ncbi:MAG: YhcH/YjgK/YiaL family protein [Clostridiales bacterium]|nr:YhcH/YjgK/YiaL family protein [Clostridiales bacterium]
MIFGNIRDAEAFGFVERKVQVCLDYMKNHDLSTMDLGTYEIEGKDIYVNLCEYVTQETEERVWECHRNYLDIHVTVTGAEQMDFGFLSRMQPGPYDAGKDLIILEGDAAGSLILNEGDFLVCYPQDVHRTAVKVGEPKNIRKAIFKVKI